MGADHGYCSRGHCCYILGDLQTSLGHALDDLVIVDQRPDREYSAMLGGSLLGQLQGPAHAETESSFLSYYYFHFVSLSA